MKKSAVRNGMQTDGEPAPSLRVPAEINCDTFARARDVKRAQDGEGDCRIAIRGGRPVGEGRKAANGQCGMLRYWPSHRCPKGARSRIFVAEREERLPRCEVGYLSIRLMGARAHSFAKVLDRWIASAMKTKPVFANKAQSGALVANGEPSLAFAIPVLYAVPARIIGPLPVIFRAHRVFVAFRIATTTPTRGAIDFLRTPEAARN